MNEIRELMQEVMTFSEERDWDQFHSPVNLVLWRSFGKK